jgi:hypothetical protein
LKFLRKPDSLGREAFSKTLIMMNTTNILGGAVALLAAFGLNSTAQPDPNWVDHDRLRPMAPVIDPGLPSTPDQVGKAPSDAVVLFDGKDVSQWVSMDGSPTQWIAKDGYMACVPGSGYVRTLQNFGDCQLHVEWAAPTPPEGNGQGRGNSGVFLGMDRYEIQVLDCYDNKTYADGAAGSIYGQYPPLVNACRAPGQWQTYDIIYTAPRFDATGKLLSPTRVTILHNGVLIQNNVELTGPTDWLDRAAYRPHPEKQPICLQDHGNPVRFRNIWVRELGQPAHHKEFTLANALLDSYVGKYEVGPNNQAEVLKDNGQLILNFSGHRFVLFAESPTRFFAKSTDVRCDFKTEGDAKVVYISVGEGDGMKATRVK